MAQWKKILDEKEIHHGHRARLLETVLSAGLSSVSDVQALEFILGYVFPRGDVNPLAHRLLNEFGCPANVLDADINSLMQIKGMGERSAKALYMLGQLIEYYTESRLSKKVKLDTVVKMVDYCEELLRLRQIENFVIIGLNAKYEVLQRKFVAKGSVKNVGISPITIANFISSVRPAYIVFTHNHPGGTAKPSKEDIKSNVDLSILLNSLGVGFVDHVIIGTDGVFSMKKDEFVRIFED